MSATIGRRDLLTQAALALAGLHACTRAPKEEIVPYAVQPPEATPGRAKHYATAFVQDGYATGLIVESHEGRPTKVEGNPDHPASLGATGVFEQASILTLYDAARLRPAMGWDQAIAALTAQPWAKAQGEGLHVLLEPTSSPSMIAALDRLRAAFPRVKVWFEHVGGPPAAWAGARLAFGAPLEPRWDLAAADVIVALDADLLGRGPQSLVLGRGFGARRDPATMNRLYLIGPSVTPTSLAADHVLAVRAHDVAALAAALASELHAVDEPIDAGAHANWIKAVAKDLAQAKSGVVIAGAEQPPAVHALAHAINVALGTAAVTYGPSPIAEAGSPAHDLGGLRDALAAGNVATLVVAGGNPAYTAPDLPLGRAHQLFALALYENETTKHAALSFPAAHYLESWGDARAFDGTISVVQPLIEPLHGGKTALELVAALAGDRRDAHALVRSRFADDRAWRRALKRGVEDGTVFATTTPKLDRAAIAQLRLAAAPKGLELVARRDPCVDDGRFAENPWLLELPQPGTTLTWTNAALVSPRTAEEHALADGDEIALTIADRTVHAPVLVVPGHADDSIALTLGWGRGHGANAFVLGAGARLGVTMRKTGARRDLPLVQPHRRLEGRDEEIARSGTLADHREHPPKKQKRALSLYELHPKAEHQWAMAIDLAKCTGCNACVVACQAENNVPTVGEDGVLMGRHMHWLRIDAYEGEHGPVVQPMLCQHCEKAPCEYVCPVNATVHSPDGLNEMVYNRCVGTRFCSNNCPYKVRRFNWFDYHRLEQPIEQLAHNPDVTVRERGVMEKCTFCVQRIREGEIREARGEHGATRTVKTACQQACSTGAIVFGDRNDAASEVARLHASDRAYAALHELGTEPRVRYLDKLRNRNPEVA